MDYEEFKAKYQKEIDNYTLYSGHSTTTTTPIVVTGWSNAAWKSTPIVTTGTWKSQGTWVIPRRIWYLCHPSLVKFANLLLPSHDFIADPAMPKDLLIKVVTTDDGSLEDAEIDLMWIE